MFEFILTALLGIFQFWLLWKVLKFIVNAKILKAVITVGFKVICYAILLPIIFKVIKWIFVLLFFAALFISCIVAFIVIYIKNKN